MWSDSLGGLIDNQPVTRIVSLVPSWSEFVFDIGCGQKLVGRTQFCIEPAIIFKIPEIGGTKNPDISKIIGLKPDLVIANKEENKRSDINLLRAHGLRVVVTDAVQVRDAMQEMIYLEHIIVGQSRLSRTIVKDMEKFKPVSQSFTYLYFVWNDPYMVAGRSTYINSVLDLAGGINAIHEQQETRYPEISKDEIAEINPDLIFLADEPYEFTDKHVLDIQEWGLSSRIVKVDGKLASWYGKRLKDAMKYYSRFGHL